MLRLANVFQAVMGGWLRVVERRAAAIVVVSAVLVAAALVYAADNLAMSTSTKDMLSAELGWRKLDLLYEQEFPQYTDNIVVVVEAATPDQALDAAHLMYGQLLRERSLFRSVYYANALSLFRESALLFLDTGELQDLADNLAAIQPFLSRLTDDQSLRGLFGMLGEAVEALDEGEAIDLGPLVRQVNDALLAASHGDSRRVSWHRLMSGRDDPAREVYREFIVLQPVLDPDAMLPTAAHIDYLRTLAKQSDIEAIGAHVRLTGNQVLEHEELLSVARGTEVALILALGLVSVIMLFGLGSVRLVIASLLTLFAGLVLTAAFAALTVGRLNLISIAFAVLYIGLGVDYAIHLCLHYRELRMSGAGNMDAIRRSCDSIGRALFLCTVSTAVGFLAFMPTDYDGVAELGWISGGGIVISFIITLALLPALLSLMPLPILAAREPRARPAWVSTLMWLPVTHARSVRLVTVVLLVLLASLLTRLQFDHNTLNLQDPDNESVQTFRDLVRDPDVSPWTGISLAGDRAAALRLVKAYKQLPAVDRVLWLEDFLPADQEQKLGIVMDMQLLLGEIPEPVRGPLPADDAQLQAVRDFLGVLDASATADTDPDLLALRLNLSAWAVQAAGPGGQARVAALSRDLLGSLGGRLDTLRASLDARPVTLSDLPADLVARWLSPEGRYLVEVHPAGDVTDNQRMREFVQEMQSVDANVIGSPVVNLAAGDAVVDAFVEAFIYALVVITLLLLVMVQRKRDVLYILLPLLLAALFTAAASVLLDIPVNFANIIALPLLLGMGVDSSVHILHRYRSGIGEGTSLLQTSAARAVVVSALTTAGGIGNLALSPHLGTASMGKLLAIGIAMTMVCSLVILPSILVPAGRKD